jgi:hypothetical protein
MKKIVSLLSFAVFVSVLSPATSHAAALYQAGSVGVDVSYPNCSTVLPKADFGIVGVTGGLVYSTNPCLAAQATKFSDLSLYVNTGLNASQTSQHYLKAQEGCNGDPNCAAYNYGKNAANDAIAYAVSQGVSSSKWWLDVETENTWSSDVMQNRASIQGAYDALKAHGAALVGVYSTTVQWNEITGGWQNGWANWGASTWTTAKQAAKYCKGHEFTGGPTLLIQFRTKQSKVSQDIAC